ncbi:glycosyltransferase [Sphingobacterium corticis]|uniref:Glycosyltransferase n=1 Tax=Sphingobacterium corticis TaxID=1812823 RepID=A0ABW5NI36_9SPHI
MIKVLHVVTRLNVGGLTTFLMNYYKHIDRSRIKFDFVAIDTGQKHAYHDQFEKFGGKVFYMPSQFVQRGTFFVKLLRNGNYSVVHCHIEVQSGIYLLLAKLTGVPVRISHAHWSRENNGFQNRVLKFLLNRVVTLRAGASNIAIEAVVGKDYSTNSRVIHNAVDLEHFKFDESVRKHYRKSFNFGDNIIIGFVGRLTHQKNILFIIEILNTLVKQRDDIRLLVVGDGEDGSLFKKEIEDRDLAPFIYWLRERSDINELMNAMDILLLPSHYEGLPLVAVEAQAASLHVIASENVTRQVNLSSFISYEPIDIGSEFLWSKAIESIGKDYLRHSTTDVLTKAGFNIKEEAKNLLNLYENLVNGS